MTTDYAVHKTHKFGANGTEKGETGADVGALGAARSVKALAPPVLRHRVILSSAAEIEGRHAEGVVASLIEQVEAPR